MRYKKLAPTTQSQNWYPKPRTETHVLAGINFVMHFKDCYKVSHRNKAKENIGLANWVPAYWSLAKKDLLSTQLEVAEEYLVKN